MISKIYLLINEYKQRGFIFSLKRITDFMLKPLFGLINRSNFLVELYYGKILRIYYFFQPGIFKFPKSELVEEVRKFWYSNTPGTFDLDSERISRKDISIYGGPNPKFTCSICQKGEWISRIRQKNLFIPHECSQSKECETLCSYQGNELWTQFHQNFDFSIGYDNNLPVAKCIFCVTSEGKRRIFNPFSDMLILVFKRQLAYSCQFEITTNPFKVNWSDYDFAYISNPASQPKFSRPNIPVILHVHDFWPLEEKKYQKIINWLTPDILLTSYPTAWKKYFNISEKTKVAFLSFFDSLFFSRPNLKDKKLDLLVIGATTSKFVYQPRINLNKQLLKLPDQYAIEFSHSAGAGNVHKKGPVLREDSRNGKPIHFLNKWSEYLGSAKYVVFGGMKYPILVTKYYEVLGSGAVPIFSEVPDLKYLKIRPFEHYIPLSEVENDNKKLIYYLDNYDKYKHIAENAVNWYKKESNKLIFEDFEKTITEITNNKYPKRII